MLSNHSPPASTPLEPCRVIPYVNVPALRGLSLQPGSMPLSGYDRLAPSSFPQHTPAFSAFDPAFISAAHQVCNSDYSNICIKTKKFTISRRALNDDKF